MTRDIIVYSFKACRISRNICGTGDFIYCLKPGRVAHSAVEAIDKRHAQ